MRFIMASASNTHGWMDFVSYDMHVRVTITIKNKMKIWTISNFVHNLYRKQVQCISSSITFTAQSVYENLVCYMYIKIYMSIMIFNLKLTKVIHKLISQLFVNIKTKNNFTLVMLLNQVNVVINVLQWPYISF